MPSFRVQDKLTTRRLPEPAFRTSSPPGPILLLRSFFRPALPARELAISTVIFSFSILLRTGEWPVDFRGRLVAGNVVSARPAILTQVGCQSLGGSLLLLFSDDAHCDSWAARVGQLYRGESRLSLSNNSRRACLLWLSLPGSSK